MLKFKDFVDHEFNQDAINEMAARRSLSRIMQHVGGNREVGILSASRSLSERKPGENAEHTNQLEHAIRTAGYSHIPVMGRYAEEHEGKQVPVKEKSFVVIGKHDGDTGLHDFLKQHASLHNQDSYIHKPHDSDRARMHAPLRDVEYLGLKKGESKDIGTFHPNRIPEYAHTVLTRGGGKGNTPAAHKTFAFSPKPHNAGQDVPDPDFPQIK